MNQEAGPKHGNWQKYHSKNPLQQFLIKRFLCTVSNLVQRSGAASIADVGCAEGFVLSHLQTVRPELQCFGVDIDKAALARGQMINPHLHTQRADIYDLPCQPRSFDLVLCTEVLEHLTQPARALVNLSQISRRHLLLSVPHEPLFRAANMARGKNLRQLGNDPEHINHWNVKTFTRFVQRGGLCVRKIETPFPWLVVLAERNGKISG